jgi:hypothetical protein
MSLPNKITKAQSIDDCFDALLGYVPQDILWNAQDSFLGIIRRAHEIGYCAGKEFEKERLRIQLGLNPTNY